MQILNKMTLLCLILCFFKPNVLGKDNIAIHRTSYLENNAAMS